MFRDRFITFVLESKCTKIANISEQNQGGNKKMMDYRRLFICVPLSKVVNREECFSKLAGSCFNDPTELHRSHGAKRLADTCLAELPEL